jgi:hypothetical protein
MHICRLLRKEDLPQDVWLYNATSITLDILSDSEVHVSWISRECNTVCDELARSAVSNGCITLWVTEHLRAFH